MPSAFLDGTLPGVIPSCPPVEYSIAPRPPRKETRFDFSDVYERRPLDKLIEVGPGPWPTDEPLPPDVEVMGATWKSNHLVGYIAYRRQEGLECSTATILRIAVLPAWQRKGVGWFLVHRMERQHFPYLGDPEAFGWEPTVRTIAQVPKTCIKGRLFFASLGFRVLPAWGSRDDYALERTRTPGSHPLTAPR